MFIEPSDNFLKINLHLSWYNFYYVHNLSNLLRHFIQLFQEKKNKKKHTDSEVTKTHVSNRHYRVNLVTAGTVYQIAVQTICLERTANQNKTALKGNELKRFVLDPGWTEA